MILVFKEFLHTSIPSLISVLYAKGCHDFPLKIFCLKVQKNFVREHFTLSLISVIEKIYASEGYTTIFRRNFFLKMQKNFVREHFSLSLISVIEKIYASEGYVTIFRRKFFVS